MTRTLVQTQTITKEMYMPTCRSAIALAIVLCSLLATPWSLAKTRKPAVTENPASATTTTNISELQSLVANPALLELRSTYNGQYGASLLLNPDTLTYYVVLFQQKTFQRVLKTSSVAKAERNYKAYAARSEQQATDDIERMKQMAEKRYMDMQGVEKGKRLLTLKTGIASDQAQEK